MHTCHCQAPLPSAHVASYASACSTPYSKITEHLFMRGCTVYCAMIMRHVRSDCLRTCTYIEGWDKSSYVPHMYCECNTAHGDLRTPTFCAPDVYVLAHGQPAYYL